MRTRGVQPRAKPETSRFPYKKLPHMPGSTTTPGRMGARDDVPIHVAFRESDHVGTRDYLAFAAQWLAYVLPSRRFVSTLADTDARLGADADRYSFTVVVLHHLLLAGFDRRADLPETQHQQGTSGSEGLFLFVARPDHWPPEPSVVRGPITYIPMAKGFVYLVAVMDWFSRRVLSWRLSITMETDFWVEALTEAMERYGQPEIFTTGAPAKPARGEGENPLR